MVYQLAHRCEKCSYVPYDENASKWIFPDPWTHQGIGQWYVFRFLVLRPFLEVLADEYNVIRDPIKLSQTGFEDALTQVLLVCL